MENYQHILLATDFSEQSNQATARAVELAQRYNAKLTLLHVVDYYPEDSPIDWSSVEKTVDPYDYLLNYTRERLEALAKRFDCENAIQELATSASSAKQEIVRIAQERQVDLIVLSSHGMRGIRALLGSTTNGVLREAPCDVLAVRATVNEG
jgi:universal stress protein A